MELFFDVDGVLLNFEHSFVDWLNQTYQLELPANYETNSWYFDDVLTPEQLENAWWDYLDSTHAGELSTYVEAHHFNSHTAQRPVHLLTNFPNRHMDKRRQNLLSHGFEFVEVHHCGLEPIEGVRPPTKSEKLSELRTPGLPALFVDDNPKNCLDVLENCPDVEVWLMTRRFNLDFEHPQIQRAESWRCLFTRLGELNTPAP